MSLAPGTRVGPYEIVEAIGAGGMSVVYRARDARLGRHVAIKSLASELGAGAAERLRRFEVEARAVGMLSHPNVLSVFDVGFHDGAPYLVTELLVGETLQARLSRGPLSAGQALAVATAVAHGLAAAHEKGIVHRDLKPGNVFLTSDGTVKVLDFGLAKLLHPDGPGVEDLTRSDLIVGTAGYMSPEQVRGRSTDARSDLFAFGAILLEMLTGRRAFQRGSAVETMNAILTEEPSDPSALAPGLPPGLAPIVRRCLEKRIEARFQSAGDLAFALETVSAASVPAGRRTPRPRRHLGRWLLSGGLAATVLVAAVTLAPRLRAARPAGPPSLRALTHSGADASPAVSPDGRTLVYSSRRDGETRIFLQRLATAAEETLTTGPSDAFPRFFPDGSSILFTRADPAGRTSLRRVSVLGGEPRFLIDDAVAADVSPDGRTIAFLRRFPDEDGRVGLLVAAASGHDIRELARFAGYVHSPRFSPDGRTIAVSGPGSPKAGAPGGITLVGLDGQVTSLPPPAPDRWLTSAAWNGDGETLLFGVLDAGLIHARGFGGRLYRQGRRGGPAEPLHWWADMALGLEIAGDGRLLYASESVRENLQLVDLSGRVPPRWLTRGAGTSRQPVPSPDGSWVLFSSDWAGNLDLWALSTRNGALRRVTDDPADDFDPAFSADGRRILWSSRRSGHFEVWTASLDGSDARRLTDDGADAENPAPSPDGKWILYGSFNPKGPGIWRVAADGTGPTLLVPGALHEVPEVSPDGRYFLCRYGILHGRHAVRVFSIEDGALVGEISFDVRDWVGSECGRARWMRDGRIAFLGVDARGVTGVFIQDFAPGRDTTATRRPVAGFDPVLSAQSFGVSPDGASVILSVRESLGHVVEAAPVVGAVRRRVESR